VTAVPLERYLRDSAAILGRSLELARSGEPWFYRVAALQLRLLLCDTTHRHNDVVDIALVPRLRPDLRLPSPLDPAQILPLSEWLEIELPLREKQSSGPALTIRQLIRRVCDQDGGAHADPRPRAGLPAEGAPDWILTLGELVWEGLGAADQRFDIMGD
jgi:hypothetical protein